VNRDHDGEKPEREGSTPMQVFEHFENWDNFANKCSVSLHAVDGNGTILWANDTELTFMGYSPDEYIGRFIGDFHVDRDVVEDILGRLTRDETVNAYPARLRAKDGSTKYVMINSNVYRQKNGDFEHTRCFTTGIDEAAWKALKQQ
jgi:PAS domain S-box-containing protein